MTEMRKDDSVGEELSAFGERAKGASKNAYGSITGDESLEREGEREMAQGKERQVHNNVFDETDGVRGATVRDDNEWVTGLYNSPESADRAYRDLTSRHGYKHDEINVLMTDDARKRYFTDVEVKDESGIAHRAAEGAGVGGGVGMGIGAALGALLAVGSNVVVPGLGLVVAGPVAAVLTGAGAGGAAGGLIGALIGAGIPEDRAKEYEEGLNNGGIVIATRPRDARHRDDLRRDYEDWGAVNVRV